MKLDIRTIYNITFIRAINAVPEEVDKSIKAGLEIATTDIADTVRNSINSGSLGLQSRSGDLAESIHSYPDSGDEFSRYIGTGDIDKVKPYSWLLGKETKQIKPKKGQWLTIPAGDNLDSRGARKSKSPRDFPDGFFVPRGDKLLFGRSFQGQFSLLFVLVKSVIVKGSGVLYDIIFAHKEKMILTVRRSIHKKLKELHFR